MHKFAILPAILLTTALLCGCDPKWNIDYEGRSARVEITRELFDSLTSNLLPPPPFPSELKT